MARLPAPREGSQLEVKQRPLEFSFWPVTRGVRRYRLHDTVFARSPWAVLSGVVNEKASARNRAEATAFLEQARDFYRAAQIEGLSANPLLLYYSFLNLAKTYLITSGAAESAVLARHGLFPRFAEGSDALSSSSIVVENDPKKQNVYPLLLQTLGFNPPKSGAEFPVQELLPQVVVGHRLWKEAGVRKERFIPAEVEIRQDSASQTMWLRLVVARGDLTKFDITHKRLLEAGALSSTFEEVKAPTGSGALWFEQSEAVTYGDRPSDQVADLIRRIKPHLWRIATTVPPYRKYYVHLMDLPHDYRLPQLASLYALLFYFGSITRYRPHVFDEIMGGRYGPFVTEFISAQPEQLLYLLTSEICEREVVKPAVI